MRSVIPINRYGRRGLDGNLAVYFNPFSPASSTPRIPDNKVYSSCGIKLQAVTEFSNDNTAPMEFILFPGLNNCLCSNSVIGGSGPLSGNMPFTNHAGVILTGTDYNQPPATAIHKWRMVSCGMKMTLINNSDENDGWFEAIRVQGSDTSGFSLSVLGTNYIIGGAGGGFPAINSGITNLPEHPTYITGKLRDIHKYEFILNPQGADHEFEIAPRVMTAETATEFMLDNENFDMIFLRVWGRAGASTPTRLMCHVVANQELVYDEASSMVRYHGNAPGTMNSMAVARKRMMSDPARQRAAKRPRTAYAAYRY